jgi:hypothetical protein
VPHTTCIYCICSCLTRGGLFRLFLFASYNSGQYRVSTFSHRTYTIANPSMDSTSTSHITPQ